MRTTKSRPYRMLRRAEQVDATRQRITEAAVRLHTTVGPAHTSIASVAEEAGVTRLTVYRHFEDLDALFVACRAHWTALDPPPDASAWPAVRDLEVRARRAFGELYDWYRRRGEELFPIARDTTSLPLSTQQARLAENDELAAALVAGFAGPDARGRSLRAVAGHLADFMTWRSLTVGQGLDDAAAVDVAVRILTMMAARPQSRGSRPAGPGSC
jgi:AcrR family transcriptional regulator